MVRNPVCGQKIQRDQAEKGVMNNPDCAGRLEVVGGRERYIKLDEVFGRPWEKN